MRTSTKVMYLDWPCLFWAHIFEVQHHKLHRTSRVNRWHTHFWFDSPANSQAGTCKNWMIFISTLSESEESLIRIKIRKAYGYYARPGSTYCSSTCFVNSYLPQVSLWKCGLPMQPLYPGLDPWIPDKPVIELITMSLVAMFSCSYYLSIRNIYEFANSPQLSSKWE